MRKTTPKTRHCPLIDEKCMKSECAIYDEKLDRCAISLTAYNLYRLSATIQAQLDSEKK